MADAETSTVWTTARLLDWTRDYFVRRGLDDARLAAEILLAKALSCQRIELYTRFDQVPPPGQLATFREFVKLAAEHTPIAYLVGSKEFFSLLFEVSSAVLIPRPETEILVERVIDHARQSHTKTLRLLEIGTGSGCISIAVLKHLEEATAVATDISPEALALAARNGASHDVADRVRWVLADGLALPADVCGDGKNEGENAGENDGKNAGVFDVLVSNPPYVAEGEMEQLDATVRDHEPAIALTDGADGLTFFRDFAEQAAHWLTPSGVVFVEVGDTQADAVRELFAHRGWQNTGTWKDTIGSHERVLCFRHLESGV